MGNVSVLIPAYNEEEKIAATVRSALRIPGVVQVVVVDDGSSDNTSRAARAAGAEVKRVFPNKGKGNALNEGARLVTGEIVVLLDGDLGATAREADKLIEPVQQRKTDMTIAKIVSGKKSGGFGLVRGLARNGVKFLTGKEMTCVLSGQRAMSKTVLRQLLPFSEGFGVELGMTVQALNRGFTILEVPVAMKHSETGKDIRGFMHRGKQFFHILKVFIVLYVGGGRNCRSSSHCS
jgi:glycosyltransferase involved in cell wall biosynthesis